MPHPPLHHAHTLGADEARRRVVQKLEQMDDGKSDIEATGYDYDEASKTFTLHLKAYGRDAKLAFVFSDADVQVTVDDDAGWAIEKLFVEPRIQKLLAEALK